MNVRRHLAICALVGASSLSASAAMAQEDKVVIGGMFDLSGAAADIGKDVSVGVKFAVDELNKSGGVLGHQVELKQLDTASNPQRAVDQGTILGREGVSMLIAPQVSASAIAASKGVSEKLKIPMCVSVSNADDLTIKQFQPYIYSMSINSYMEIKAVADLLAKQPYKRYALLGVDSAGPRAGLTRFKEFIKELNPDVEFVAEEYTKFGATDFSASINKLRASEPDYVMSSIFGADLITFSKQAVAIGFFEELENRFIALYDSNTLAALGEAAGLETQGYQRAPFSLIVKNDPVGSDYIEAFKTATGSLPSDWTTEGYECVMAWAQAAANAGSVDADPVMQALETGEFDLPRGKLTIGESDHQVEVPAYIGTLVQSEEYGQPILDITDVIPADKTRPSKETLEALRGS